MRVRLSREVEPGLFHDTLTEEEAYAPPRGPVMVGQEELIQRAHKHRIHVTHRRIDMFVPPVWKEN
jgi:hypothetical protein